MGSTIVQLLPFMIASAIQPIAVVIVLLALRQPGGLGVAIGYIGGMTAVRVVQGIFLGSAAEQIDHTDGKNDQSTIATVLLLVIGILMIVKGTRSLLKAEDPDAPPPGWMARLKELTPVKAFGFSAGMMAISAKHWVFMLGAIAVIAEGNLGDTQAVIAFTLFVIGAQLLLIAPVAAFAISPERTQPVLAMLGNWLERRNRQILIVVSFGFGAYFLWKAASSLFS